jgi:hypothetical protein
MIVLRQWLEDLRQLRVRGSDWAAALLVIVIAGILVVVFYSFHASEKHEVAAAVGLLLSGACFLLGALIGFLFGIPRSLQGTTSADQESTGRNTANRRERVRYGANTNLEQISDWLTKILVGVGLTQLGSIADHLRDASTYFGPVLGGPDNGAPAALVIILYFASSGFLLGYLWTRLHLAGELARADVDAIVDRVRDVEEAQKQQAQIDAVALSLATQYLDRTTDPTRIKIEDLKHAIETASPAVKVQIFYQANGVRRTTWQKPEDKPFMERTIPIFEALVASDKDGRFHKNYGQLGFALKDKRVPDWQAAEAALSRAIEIRGSWRDQGWTIYELNRAICRIMLDGSFRDRQPSPPEVQAAVHADLKVARTTFPDFRGIEVIHEWLALNPPAQPQT